MFVNYLFLIMSHSVQRFDLIVKELRYTNKKMLLLAGTLVMIGHGWVAIAVHVCMSDYGSPWLPVSNQKR